MASELRAHLCKDAFGGLTTIIARIYSADMSTVIADVPLSEVIDGSYVGDVPPGVLCGEYPVHIIDNADPLNPLCLVGGTLIWDGFSEASRPDISGSSSITS